MKMSRAAIALATFVCLLWALIFLSLSGAAHAATKHHHHKSRGAAATSSLNGPKFLKEWNSSKVNLSTSTGPVRAKAVKGSRAPDVAPPVQMDPSKADPKADAKPNAEEKKPAKKTAKHKRRGSSTPPPLVQGADERTSNRQVCQSQCELERQGCDQGRDAFRDRRDQITSYQSSCYLAVQSCMSRC